MKCSTPYCRNSARKSKKVCHKCTKRKWRKKYPLKACYQNLKCNAKRRGKAFSLTYEEFLLVIDGTGYIDGHGRYAKNYSIDRADNNKGYSYDNARVVTVSENSTKYTSSVDFTRDEAPF